MSITTSKVTPPSPSPSNSNGEDSGADQPLAFPVETDIVIHANGDVTIADLPQELGALLSLLAGPEHPE